MDLNVKIDLKDIDFNKLKDFFKKKEALIGIGIFVFIIAIIIIGNHLISGYNEANSKLKSVKSSYERVIAGDTSIESLKEKIFDVNNEAEQIAKRLFEISQKDVAEMLLKIQEDTGITWTNKSFIVKSSIKDAPKLKAISVTISSFSGTYSAVKDFMDYIDNLDREVSIDSLNFSKDKLTGKMTGNMTLTFYMINEAT